MNRYHKDNRRMFKVFLISIHIIFIGTGCIDISSQDYTASSNSQDTIYSYHANGNKKSCGVLKNGHLGAEGQFRNGFKSDEWIYFKRGDQNAIAEIIPWGVYDDSVCMRINVPVRWTKFDSSDEYIVAYVRNDSSTFKSNFSINS